MDLLQRIVSESLGLDNPEDLHVGRSLLDQGMDSLTAADIHLRLSEELGLELPVTAALDHPSIEALVDFLLNEIIPSPSAGGVPKEQMEIAPG